MTATTGTVPRGELNRRIGALQEHLAERGLEVAVILQHVDLYYFAGTIQTCHLLVPQSGEPRLLVRKVLERARADSNLEDVRPLASLRRLADEVRDLCGPPPWRVGMELDVLPVNLFALYRDRLSEAEIEDISPAVLALRARKSEWEIDRIRDAARISDLFYREIGECFEAGISTYELQAILGCRAAQAGHLGYVRLRGFNVDGLMGTVVSGPTGALPGHSQFAIGGRGPHPFVAHGGDFEPIQRDMPIIFDYNANVSGYHHDQTRMAVWGEMPAEAERIYEALRGILRSLEEELKPGACPASLYAGALAGAKANALEAGFMGMPGCAVPFVGHAVGLEVDEPPVLARGFDEALVAGNVLAVEPKFRHPQLGVIGIENTYVVRENGVENLSSSPEDVVRMSM